MQFANPLAFWLLSAAAPLAAMYFLKVRRRKVRVPSLMLWTAVIENQRRARPWDRFRRHDLLWLQLLALLLLTLALAGPSIPGKKLLGRSVVWIVDGSASMAAAAPKPSRFEVARSLVVGELGQLGATDEGMVLLAGSEPRVVSSFTRDKERLETAVRGMSATDSATSLGSAIDLAVALTRSRPDRTLVVVTDGSDPGVLEAMERHPGLRVEIVGTAAPNVAITAIDLRRSPTDDLRSELFVTLRRFGGTGAPVGIEVTLDGELLATESVDLPVGRPVARVYRELGDQGGLVRVQVATGDALASDDEAVAWLEPPARRQVLCVGCSVLTARALAADSRFSVTAGESPSAASTPEQAVPDAIVFEGEPVPEEPGAPFLALGSPSLGAWAAPAAVEWPRVTQWRRSHPALRFVQPGGLHITRARPAAPAGWEPLIESDGGPLLSTGILGGVRGVALHFLPTESDLPLRVSYPILILNSLGWLSGQEARGSSRTLAAGSPLIREGWGGDGEEVLLLSPSGSEVRVPIREGVARFGGLEHTGVYRLRGPGGRQERIAVNLVSDSESDLSLAAESGAASPATAGSEGTGGATASTLGRLSLVRPFLLLLGLLLVVEWLLYQRKYRDE